jgi:FAD/FMN-containing dehydrogenase
MSNDRSRISRRELIMGSAAASGLAMMGVPSLSVAQQAGASAAASPFQDLAAKLSGPVITPGHDRYDQERQVFNAMIDRRPAAIAKCSGAADVMDAVKYAREKSIPVTVRGGGHAVSGKAVRDGALTIDLGRMHGIWVDPARKRAMVQGGVRLEGVDRETLAHGLVAPVGTVGKTGVGGLTLGGGLGWLMRKHGLTCDNLVSADVVTADGRFLRASGHENPDLFWAIRGGGGNFGVVASFEFLLHEAEPIVGGMALYPESMLRDMLEFYRDYTASAPDSVTTYAGAMTGPPGTAVEGEVAGLIAVCHSGPVSEGESVVKPIKDFGPPALDTIGPTTFQVIQAMFGDGSPNGTRHYWRSAFVPELADGAIDTFVERSKEMPHAATLLLVEHMGGAVSRVGTNQSAFANRDAMYNLSLLGAWMDPAEDAKNIAWSRAVGDELRSFSSGGAYVNYMSDEDAAAVKGAYEANYQRLVDIKRKYDPGNFWSGNHNIAPD